MHTLSEQAYNNFVNVNNNTNVDLDSNYDESISACDNMSAQEQVFMQRMRTNNIVHTHVDERGDPVLVFMRDDEAVAYYDLERYCGYISTAS